MGAKSNSRERCGVCGQPTAFCSCVVGGGLAAARKQVTELLTDLEEQSRLLGKSAEREATLLGKLLRYKRLMREAATYVRHKPALCKSLTAAAEE